MPFKKSSVMKYLDNLFSFVQLNLSGGYEGLAAAERAASGKAFYTVTFQLVISHHCIILLAKSKSLNIPPVLEYR